MAVKKLYLNVTRKYPHTASATAFCALWILLATSGVHFSKPEQLTEQLIRATDKLVQNHVRAWGEAPKSMNELRLFARQTYSRYSAYDIWGERLEYLRLGKINYTIRSFGADGFQNRPGESPDPGIFRWGPLEERGLRYNEESGNMQSRPSIVLFAGADDSSGHWHAKLFVDVVSGTRRLLVRDRRESRFYMLAPHDGVEEFLWVPGQEKIIFTATKSARFADGVYLWDLRSDESTNLLTLDGDGKDLDPGRQERGYYLSLSSIRSGSPAKVAAFIAGTQNLALNPDEFFSPAHLHVFELGERPRHIVPEINEGAATSLFNLDFLGTGTVMDPQGYGSPVQRAWLRLPMGGDWEKAVLSWQEFAATHGKTQLAPYAVWGLAMFYNEAAGKSGGANAQIFASYAKELGQALSQMPSSPGYMRAIGAWMAAPQTVK